jgi:hypothetical protein
MMRQWSLTATGLQLRAQVQEAAPVRFVKAFADGWVYGIDGGILSIDRAGSAPLRLDLGKPVHRISLSPDMRYFAASVASELVVIDVRANKLATLAIDSPDFNITFVDGSSLALVSATGLQVVHVDDLDYERF